MKCHFTGTERQSYIGRGNEKRSIGTEGPPFPHTVPTVMTYQRLTSIPSPPATLRTPNPPGLTLTPIWTSNTAAAPAGTRRRTRRAPAHPTSRPPLRAVDMHRDTSRSPRHPSLLPLLLALVQHIMPVDLQTTRQIHTLNSTPLTQIQIALGRIPLAGVITLPMVPCDGHIKIHMLHVPHPLRFQDLQHQFTPAAHYEPKRAQVSVSITREK